MTKEDDREWAEIEKEIQTSYSFYEEKTVKHRYMIVMIEKKEDINAETGTEVLRAAPGAGVEAGPGVP